MKEKNSYTVQSVMNTKNNNKNNKIQNNFVRK